MQFITHDLGFRIGGEVVEVALSGNAANVRLMDSANFNRYRSNGRCRFYRGLARQSKVHLAIPYFGHWYVAVDLEGLCGSVRSSARVLP
jgi:hypothetical protein